MSINTNTTKSELPCTEFTVTQEAIRAYAEVTQDFNPLHLDPAFAAKTPMGSVIAHGTMSINLIWRSVAAAFGADAIARGTLDIRFVAPVRVGDTLRAGGSPREGEPGSWDVWVRGADGTDRIVGQLHLPAR